MAISKNVKLLHWPFTGGRALGCYIWYSKDGTVGAAARPGPSSLY